MELVVAESVLKKSCSRTSSKPLRPVGTPMKRSCCAIAISKRLLPSPAGTVMLMLGTGFRSNNNGQRAATFHIAR
eukprot:2824106-Amphidinium_carterae.1